MKQITAKDVTLTDNNLEFTYTYDNGETQHYLVPVNDGEISLVELDKVTWKVLRQVAEEEREKFKLKRSLMGLD